MGGNQEPNNNTEKYYLISAFVIIRSSSKLLKLYAKLKQFQLLPMWVPERYVLKLLRSLFPPSKTWKKCIHLLITYDMQNDHFDNMYHKNCVNTK